MVDLAKILPHKPPMILIDDVVEIDLENNSLTAKFDVYPQKLFFEDGKGINSLVGIEFMAQTIGCYAYYKRGDKEPRPGLLLGSRLYNNKIDYFLEGNTYFVKASEIFDDNEIVVFDCLIYDSIGNELASATINAYQGENIEEVLKNE